MNNHKIQLMWVPFNRDGKVRIFVLPSLVLRSILTFVLLCILAIPIFQFGFSVLTDRIQLLEDKNFSLVEEIKALQYVKQSLYRIEEKDRVLRDYFGMQEYQSLEQIIGLGGEHRQKLSGLDTQNRSQTPAPAEIKVSQGLQGKMEMVLKRLAGNYDIFHYLIKKQDEIWDETPSIMPLNTDHFRMTSAFGWRNNPFTHLREFHTGIDVVGPEGTKIIAPAKAVVVASSNDNWLGNYVVLDHGKGVKTIYGHLEKALVKSGNKLKKGDTVAIMGNTGLSTSRHLHYMIVINDRIMDPRQYILNFQG
ncbi:MAG: M23 family metallopeptidase [Desulfobacteraceae bacterium]|nr:MAG: M23 family metallopeptidase [Desulfobacteraceae bacterium]